MIKRNRPLAEWFNAREWVDALCPACRLGMLRAEPAHKHESTESRNAQGVVGWDPDWVHGYFTSVLRCQRASCQEITVAMGRWCVRENNNEFGQNFDDYFLLQMTVPPLPIMYIPDGCPAPVSGVVDSAAQVMWVDPSAAANRLRIAVEQLLDAHDIPRTKTEATKESPLNLHKRIDLLRATHPSAADLLEAVKWIGNQGSHEDTLRVSDVLEGAQLFERALAQMYDTTPAELQRRAAQINKARKFVLLSASQIADGDRVERLGERAAPDPSWTDSST